MGQSVYNQCRPLGPKGLWELGRTQTPTSRSSCYMCWKYVCVCTWQGIHVEVRCQISEHDSLLPYFGGRVIFAVFVTMHTT